MMTTTTTTMTMTKTKTKQNKTKQQQKTNNSNSSNNKNNNLHSTITKKLQKYRSAYRNVVTDMAYALPVILFTVGIISN
jgi:hypothetical protein